MFATQMLRNVLQRATCLLAATVIVTINLAIGTMGADYAKDSDRYSVTITQLS